MVITWDINGSSYFVVLKMFLFHKKSVRSYVLKFRVYGLEAMHSVWDEIFQLTTYIIHIIKQRIVVLNILLIVSQEVMYLSENNKIMFIVLWICQHLEGIDKEWQFSIKIVHDWNISSRSKQILSRFSSIQSRFSIICLSLVYTEHGTHRCCIHSTKNRKKKCILCIALWHRNDFNSYRVLFNVYFLSFVPNFKMLQNHNLT